MAKEETISNDTVVPPITLKDEHLEKEARKQPEMSEKEKTGLEREIRRYVRKIGGYRKNLPQAEKELCAKLLRRREGPLRKKLEWDLGILVPGMDKPSVAKIVQKKQPSKGMPELSEVQ